MPLTRSSSSQSDQSNNAFNPDGSSSPSNPFGSDSSTSSAPSPRSLAEEMIDERQAYHMSRSVAHAAISEDDQDPIDSRRQSAGSLISTPELAGSTVSSITAGSRPPTALSNNLHSLWANTSRQHSPRDSFRELGPVQASNKPPRPKADSFNVISSDEAVNVRTTDRPVHNTTEKEIRRPQQSLQEGGSASIMRNSLGQRVDPLIPHDHNEVQRVKQMKLCNVYYLRGSCAKPVCTHGHSHIITPRERACLRVVARMAPCHRGGACDSKECIYGHCCPAPKGRKDELCTHGKGCKFSNEMHNVPRD